MQRESEYGRATAETSVDLDLNLDGTGLAEVKTGLGFLDHMITTLVRHARFDLRLGASGDLITDDHHTVEDCAIGLGRALVEALGDRVGINRFGYSYVALDESLSRAVVDLSGRPWSEISLDLKREMVGDVATENIVHFFRTFAAEARIALHVDTLRGDNDHHKAEAAFKSVALALRQAVEITGTDIPSTKGTLE